MIRIHVKNSIKTKFKNYVCTAWFFEVFGKAINWVLCVIAILSITLNWSNTRICKLIDHCWKCCATSPLPNWLFSGDTILNQTILLSDGIYTLYSRVVLWVSWLYSSVGFISKRPIKKKRENETQNAYNTMKGWEYKKS